MKRLLIFLGLTVFYFSCTNNKVDPSCSLPDSVSFQTHILPIFRQNCSLSGCHSGTSPSANLNLEDAVAYAKLSKKSAGYIDTINPKNSVLYASMVSISNPMPPKGNLDTCTIHLIIRWMEQKAKNN